MFATSSCIEGALITARKPAEGIGENDHGLHRRQRSADEARPMDNGTLSRTPFPDERVKAEVPRRRHESAAPGHPAWSPSAFGLEDYSRPVVLKRVPLKRVPGEVAYSVEQGVEDGVGRFPLVRPNDGERAPQPELLSLR